MGSQHKSEYPGHGPANAPGASGLPMPRETTIMAGPGHMGGHHQHGYAEMAVTRDLFWQNVVREMLTSLSMVADSRRYQLLTEMQTRQGQLTVDGSTITTSPELTPAALQGGAGGDENRDADSDGDGDDADGLPAGSHPDLPLDGRVAILTKGGERIPIADVRPLLACSVPGTEAERALSIDVQCTIFQVVAPSGEVFTLPLHEIRGIHAISEELMDRLKEASRRQDTAAGRRGDADDSKPFGFAAFTSLAQNQAKKRP